MENNRSAIIIGAGIGGIATAVFLARKGYKIDIYEKNNYPGGRCSQILRDGHRFDAGATILMMPSIYRDVFKALGFDFDKTFELKSLPVIYKLYFVGKEPFSFTTDQEIMKTQIESIEKGGYEKFRKYISKGYSFFNLAMDRLLSRNFRNFFQFINLGNALMLVKLKTYLKHSTFVSRYFQNDILKQAFTFQNIYVGQNPLEAPALFAMLPAAELSEGAYFPIGGMYSITEKLYDTAIELGVKFHFGKTVVKINTSGNKAESIELAKGIIKKADVIICNADLPYIYKELLPTGRKSKRIEKKKYSCSAMVFHWGLKKTYTQLSHHSVFLSPNQKESLDVIFRDHSISVNPSFYIHSPAGTDPSAAPEGGDSISVVVPMGYVDSKSKQNWNLLIKNTRTAIIKRLAEIGMTDIEENIKFEICYPPTTWESIFNVSRGSVFGSLKHNIMQMGYFRPHNRHSKFRNLYFAGGSTHPGNGVPLVLLSAKHTSERILAEM